MDAELTLLELLLVVVVVEWLESASAAPPAMTMMTITTTAIITLLIAATLPGLYFKDDSFRTAVFSELFRICYHRSASDARAKVLIQLCIGLGDFSIDLKTVMSFRVEQPIERFLCLFNDGVNVHLPVFFIEKLD